MTQVPNVDENLQISFRVQDIKNRTILNKNIMSDFLESYIIVNTNFSINDYLTYYIWQMESSYLSSTNYTYWVAGGFSWNNWFNNDNDYLIEEKVSMTTGNFEVHYIYIDETIFDKIKSLYFLTLKLKEILAFKGINTEIIITNFEVQAINNEQGVPTNYDFKFNKVYNALFKEPFFNIKLILKLDVSVGGAKPPRKFLNKNLKFSELLIDKPHHKQFKNKPQPILLLRELAKLMSIKRVFTEDEKKQLISKIDIFNNKTIVEFQLDLFETTPDNTEKKLNIEEFNNAYIIKPKIATTFNPQVDNILTMRLKLNKLNELGLITYSYLTTTNRFSEMGLNVDLYRQNIFIKKQLGNNKELIVPYFEKVLKNYIQLFKNRKSYNVFFVEKIEEIINSNSSYYYNDFIDFIDKWFISKFRPSINSFIKDINSDLEKFNVKLFVAGGDAMRRYDTNISFSKDIDTKLYIANAISPTGTNLDKTQIKQAIIDIIINHIVKLRNFLQQNFKLLFTENCISTDKKIIYKTDTKVFQIYLSTTDKKYQQFRTREIKKSDLFPVDLYSIDFNTKIIEYDILTKKETFKLHTISLLDVVLQDNDNLYPHYYKIFDDIPVASLQFLLEDFIKTYTTDDRALARIASGKYEKDIKRYERLFELYNKEKLGTLPSSEQQLLLSDDEIQYIIDNIISVIPSKTTDIIRILNKFKNKTEFDICDLITIIEMVKNKTITDKLQPEILNLLKDLAYLNKNFYFEQLNKADPNYHNYDYRTTKDYIAIKYLDLFKALCSLNDGQQKHSVSYNIYKIKSDYYEYVKKQPLSSSKKTSITKKQSNIIKNLPKKVRLSTIKESRDDKQSSLPIITSRGRISKPTLKFNISNTKSKKSKV